MSVGITAVAAAMGIGFAAGRVRPTPGPADPHASHDMSAMASGPAVQQAPGIPAFATNVNERIAKSPRHAEWVAIKMGATDSVMAWVVYPERKDKAPVVIAIHENTGITTWTRGVADQLAADGFIGIAPDLTTMFKTRDIRTDTLLDEGRAGIPKVTPELGNAIIDAVAKYGMSLPAAQQKYGILGFCWGGGKSFLYATHAPTLGASIVFYGTPPKPEEMAAIKAPVLGLYGGNDARVDATIPATDSTMKALGKSYEYQIFDGAGHGFMRGSTPENGKAAEAAWPKAIAFLKAKLK